MQLMADAVAVLGSRHGIVVDPVNKNAAIVRFDQFEARRATNVQKKLSIKAGIRIEDKEVVFPLCPDSTYFDFCDQRITPCTTKLIGIHSDSALRVTLEFITPFRPRDAVFSTTPVIQMRLTVKKLAGNFRWERKPIRAPKATMFLQVDGEELSVNASKAENTFDITFESWASYRADTENDQEFAAEALPQHDRLVSIDGSVGEREFSREIDLSEHGEELSVFWCTYNGPVLHISDKRYPFKYSEQFGGLDDVCEWVKKNPSAIYRNAENVSSIVLSHSAGASISHMMCQALHSWLINSWWVVRDGGKDWFSVWEGSCYYHSTVDVEYTQSPFYLAMWPELLKIELDFWTDYSKDGSIVLGDSGKDTLYLSHDVGQHCWVGTQIYPHDMPVEETTNYLILLFCYWKRTGDFSLIEQKKEILQRYLAFVKNCDSTGSGVPDIGVANTIDDASPAVQYGKDQVYLAVKVMAAYLCGKSMLAKCGVSDTELAEYGELAAQIKTRLENDGWQGDHFATLLDKSTDNVVNPWTKQPLDVPEVPGWDSAHIYTINGIALLDMVGFTTDLDEEKLRRDLEVATSRCLSEYGCVHSDFMNTHLVDQEQLQGLAGSAKNPGWISMNMLRDIGALYRGIDFRHLSERYWEWQTTTNSQEPKLFFETFKGNNLCWYPRGIAIWGIFDAIAGQVIDTENKIDSSNKKIGTVSVPRLFDADWEKGTCRML